VQAAFAAGYTYVLKTNSSGTTAIRPPGTTHTAQMLHVWVVPYPGGVFSDDLSEAATNSAVQAVLAQHS